MTRGADRFLPYGRQCIEDDDIAAVTAVLRSDFLTTGPAVEAFEAEFAARTGAAFAVACSSGTAALHIAAAALGLGEGDAAVVPSMTFLATANAARYVGAEVVFADVDPETGVMTAATLEHALERATPKHGRVRAVFPVHLNGQCADMAAIAGLARSHGLAIIEDTCHALGARHRSSPHDGAMVGSCVFGDLSAFSFHPVKTVAMGEGGLVTTNDAALRDRLVRIRNHGIVREPAELMLKDQAFGTDRTPHPWYYEMPELGFNYRASDIHCALGLSQLKKLGRFVAERQRLVDHYDALLAPLAPAIRPVRRVSWCDPAWHLYVVLIDFEALGATRDDVMKRLRAKGIGTQVHYVPVHRQPYYRNRYGAPDLPGADAYYAKALSLPLFVGMTEDDVTRVADALAAIAA